MCESMVDI